MHVMGASLTIEFDSSERGYEGARAASGRAPRRRRSHALRRSCALIALSMSIGCTQIPATPPYSPGAGATSCQSLARAAEKRQAEEFLAGAAIVAAGLIGVGSGIAMGPDTSPDAQWQEKSRYLMILTPSAVVAGIGIASMVNAQSSDRLRYQAAHALAEAKDESDRFVYYRCVSARDDWSGDHADTTNLQIALMKEAASGTAAAQEVASSARAQSESATSVAVDARTSAIRASQVAHASAEAAKDLASVAEQLADSTPPKSERASAREKPAKIPVPAPAKSAELPPAAAPAGPAVSGPPVKTAPPPAPPRPPVKSADPKPELPTRANQLPALKEQR
jgi:hypothetical protein